MVVKKYTIQEARLDLDCRPLSSRICGALPTILLIEWILNPLVFRDGTLVPSFLYTVVPSILSRGSGTFVDRKDGIRVPSLNTWSLALTR